MTSLTWDAYNCLIKHASKDFFSSHPDYGIYLGQYFAEFNFHDQQGIAVNTLIQQDISFSLFKLEGKTTVKIIHQFNSNVVLLYFNNGAAFNIINPEGDCITVKKQHWSFLKLPKGHYQFIHENSHEAFQFVSLHFTEQSLKSFLGSWNCDLPNCSTSTILQTKALATHGKYSSFLNEKLLEHINSVENDIRFQLKVKSLFFELFVYFLNHYSPISAPTTGTFQTCKANLELVKEVLLKQFDNPPPFKKIALRIGVSESVLYKAFKSAYGITPNQFLLNHKLAVAHSLLEKQGADVNGAAYHVGYSSVSSFSKAFFKRYGIRPGTLLKQDINEIE